MHNKNEKSKSEVKMASKGKMISYSFGDVVAYYLSYAYAIFIFFFYEVEVGLPIILVGLAFVIFAVWNMINDPLVGYLTDKPFKWTKKWGLRFPWIMLGIFPTLIFYFLIFTPPNIDVKANYWPIFFYMVIIMCLFDFFYSLFSVHFFGAFTNQFRSDEERRIASIYDNIIPGLGAFFLGLIPPLFIIYGNINSYALAAIIVVVIMFICAIITIPGVSESEELKEIFIRGYETTEQISFFKTMKTVFGIKNFVISIIAYLLLITARSLSMASGLYYFKDVYGLPYSYAVLTQIAGYVAFVISIPFWAKVAKKIGHAQTFTLGYLFIALAFIPFLWATTIEEAIIYNLIGGIGYGAFYFMLLAVFADVNDEVALNIGKRQEATLEGVRTFFYRIAIILQAMIMVIVHIATDYNPNPQAKQTPLAVWGIRVHGALIPFIFCFIGFLIMFKWYDLKGEKKESIFAQLEEKHLK